MAAADGDVKEVQALLSQGASVNAKEFNTKFLKLEGSHLIRLKSDSPELRDRVALIRGTQHHPVTGDVLHADFLEIDLTQKLNISVPLHYVGKPVGVALQGGILQPIRREVDVFCLPTDIPEFIEVDVSSLNIHDAIHVDEIKAPEGVEISYDTNYTLVTLLPPTVEEVKVEVAAEAVAGEAVPAAEAAGAEAAKPEAAAKGAKPESAKGA